MQISAKGLCKSVARGDCTLCCSCCHCYATGWLLLLCSIVVCCKQSSANGAHWAWNVIATEYCGMNIVSQKQQQQWLGGRYSSELNTLWFNSFLICILTHDTIHPVLHSLSPPVCPCWLAGGLDSHQEQKQLMCNLVTMPLSLLRHFLRVDIIFAWKMLPRLR